MLTLQLQDNLEGFIASLHHVDSVAVDADTDIVAISCLCIGHPFVVQRQSLMSRYSSGIVVE